jgi:hypothetical protein
MQNPKVSDLSGYKAGQKRRLYDIKFCQYSRDRVPDIRNTDPGYIESYKAGYHPIAKPVIKPKVKKNVKVDADGLQIAQELGLNISKICSDAIVAAAIASASVRKSIGSI